MFESLRDWCKFPFMLHPFKEYSVTGEPIYDTTRQVYGYRVDNNVLIVDTMGSEYVSSTQLYISPSSPPVTVMDAVSLDGRDTRIRIRKIGAFYDGNDGTASVQVLYL